MGIPTNNWVFADGNHGVATFVGLPVFSNPFPGVASQYTLTQECMQYCWGNQLPLALNTLHPYYAGYYLVSESERSDAGSGMVKWKRTYCQLPSERFEASNIVYQYPGINTAYHVPGTNNVTPVTRRIPSNVITNAKLVYDYYIIDASGLLPGGYTDFVQIPVITHQKWYYQIYNGPIPVGLGELLPPWVSDAGTSVLGNAFTVINGTLPTAITYLDAIGLPFNVAGAFTPPTAGADNVLSGGGRGTGYGWFAATDSQLTRWQGNIFQRMTTFIPVL